MSAAAACAGCGAGAHPRLTATPSTALVDRTIDVRLTGAKPGERVTIGARVASWTSRGVFRADSHGTVDLARESFVGRFYLPPYPRRTPVLVFGGSEGGLTSSSARTSRGSSTGS